MSGMNPPTYKARFPVNANLLSLHGLSNTPNVQDSDDPYAKRGEVMFMSREDFTALSAHPCQRNEKVRVNKPQFQTPHVTHVVVAAALHPLTGELHKVDGHTRAYAWETGTLEPAPKELTVIVYQPATEDDFDLLYETFDNRNAMETPRDIMTGLLRKAALEDPNAVFDSSYLASGGFLTALTYGEGAQGIAKDRAGYSEHIAKWFDELATIDELGGGFFHGPMRRAAVVAAMLMSVRKYGDAVIPFWKAVSKAKGLEETNPSFSSNSKFEWKRQPRRQDTVQKASEMAGVLSTPKNKHANHRPTSGRGLSEDLMLHLLSVVDDHMDADETFWYCGKVTPLGVDDSKRSITLNRYREQADTIKAVRVSGKPNLKVL